MPSFRETAAEIWRGREPADILLAYGGYSEGGAIPEGVNNFPVTIPVGTQTISAAGVAYAVQYQEKPQVVMVFFGDGATSEGDFHEAMNFAGVFTLPLIFLCQNNQWAISVPLKKQTRSRSLAQKAVAYGLPGIQVDGNDVLAVYAAAREAADRAREKKGPTMIECVTYRMSLHTTADDPSRYRSQEEVKAWEKKDPISRLQTYLTGKDILSKKDLDSVREEINQEIEDAEKRWKQKMVIPSSPRNARALLVSAIRDPDPVAFRFLKTNPLRRLSRRVGQKNSGAVESSGRCSFSWIHNLFMALPSR